MSGVQPNGVCLTLQPNEYRTYLRGESGCGVPNILTEDLRPRAAKILFMPLRQPVGW